MSCARFNLFVFLLLSLLCLQTTFAAALPSPSASGRRLRGVASSLEANEQLARKQRVSTALPVAVASRADVYDAYALMDAKSAEAIQQMETDSSRTADVYVWGERKAGPAPCDHPGKRYRRYDPLPRVEGRDNHGFARREYTRGIPLPHMHRNAPPESNYSPCDSYTAPEHLPPSASPPFAPATMSPTPASNLGRTVESCGEGQAPESVAPPPVAATQVAAIMTAIPIGEGGVGSEAEAKHLATVMAGAFHTTGNLPVLQALTEAHQAHEAEAAAAAPEAPEAAAAPEPEAQIPAPEPERPAPQVVADRHPAGPELPEAGTVGTIGANIGADKEPSGGAVESSSRGPSDPGTPLKADAESITHDVPRVRLPALTRGQVFPAWSPSPADAETHVRLQAVPQHVGASPRVVRDGMQQALSPSTTGTGTDRVMEYPYKQQSDDERPAGPTWSVDRFESNPDLPIDDGLDEAQVSGAFEN
eukprot:gnl/Spiro4/22126_TR10891_c0_g1_i2.p1 gnl/Spiro4/22126_TR10891_c0_g1~~gnl/Spiro4/22126_TR10891_c0_g1_i2.p1  ORF type:complete len:503 (+),score=103.33 gnl/Spiro4/22126_TR10891_c0_g1_i2:84-1511(+)